MNRTILTGAGIFLLLLNLQLFGRPPRGEKLGPGFGQRYLLLATTRTSTMQKELRQAAAAGYRVLAGWSAPEYERGPHHSSSTSPQIVMLLEKVAAPPITYECLLLATVRSSTLQKELREAAARGFRLLPNTVGEFEGEIILIMEKAPGSSSRYDYLVLADATAFARSTPAGGGLHKAWLAKEKLRAVSNGYSLVGMVSRSTGGEDAYGETSPLQIQHVLIAEKPAQPDAEVMSQASRASARERYLLLVGSRTADLQEPLSRAAEQGYRLLVSSYSSPQIVFVMEKVAQPDQTYQYLVASGQDQLGAAAARGFRPHPAGVFGTITVMEKAPGSEDPDKYFSIFKTSSSALQEELADAGAEGLNVVAASRNSHTVVLQKAAGRIAESQAAPPQLPAQGHGTPYPSRSVCLEDEMAIPPGSKVYVRPMDGFETYVVAALKKKKVPLLVVIAPEGADFEISGTTKIHETSKAGKVLEIIGVITSIPSGESAGDFPRKLEVNISVRNIRTGSVLFEHSVSKHSTARALDHYQRSAAEACADQLKKKILERKPK